MQFIPNYHYFRWKTQTHSITTTLITKCSDFHRNKRSERLSNGKSKLEEGIVIQNGIWMTNQSTQIICITIVQMYDTLIRHKWNQ